MNIDQTLEQIKDRVKQEVENGNSTESNIRLENGELLWAALAFLGYGYSQVRGSKEDSDPSEFYPFGKFDPSETPQENLVRACQMIIFEIDRLNSRV